jgi:Flp pilus assembly protein TadG
MDRVSRNSKQYSRRSGAAVVEFAVTLPVLILILLATLEACTMIYVTQTLQIASYEATRVALVPKSTKAQVEFAANRILNDRRVKNAVIKITPLDFTNAPIQSFIQIDITAPANTNSIVSPMFFKDKTLRANCSMMKEY